MCSTRVTVWKLPAAVLAILALAICTLSAVVWLGPEAFGSAVVQHLGPRAGEGGRVPVPGLASAIYAVALRSFTRFAHRIWSSRPR